jgi:hypothetical protein
LCQGVRSPIRGVRRNHSPHMSNGQMPVADQNRSRRSPVMSANAVFQDLKDTFLMMAIARPVAEVSLVQSRCSRMVSRVRCSHNHAAPTGITEPWAEKPNLICGPCARELLIEGADDLPCNWDHPAKCPARVEVPCDLSCPRCLDRHRQPGEA